VSKVVAADGRVLYAAAPDGERRFPEQVARNVTEAMLDVTRRDGLDLPDRRPVAAKTGTVESRFRGESNDAWMAGFTPQLAASVWIGTDRNSPIRTTTGDPISGRTLPGEVWQGFMAAALRTKPPAAFPAFQPIGAPPSDAAPSAAGAAGPTPTARPARAVPGPPSVAPGSRRAAGARTGAVDDPAEGPDHAARAEEAADRDAAGSSPVPAPRLQTAARSTDHPDCSITPCG
jgi:peptidoglycan glycosyltransferase